MKNIITDIAILGAGIGGYETFRTLAKLLKRKGINKKITIIDRHNYFTFTPMLHEVASGSLEPQHAAIPLRELVYKTPHIFLKATVEQLDPRKKIIKTDQGDVHYEFAVLALGSSVNFFNTRGAKEFCYTVRTLPRAMKLHEDLFHLLECTASNLLSLTVVGGGFTGVEIVGQFMHLINHDLKKLYPEKKLQINLIESGPTILGPLPKRVQEKIKAFLIKRGVKFYFNHQVQEVQKQKILFADGTELKSDLTIWSAGVQNTAPTFLDESYCEKGRLNVNEFLQSKIESTLYGVGDIALSFNHGSDKPQPQLGETAHKEGQYAARHIVASIQNKTIKPFRFKSAGTLMPIGDWYGVALIGPFTFFGRLAWWIRRTVYVHFMPGLIRKLRIVLDWTLHSFGFRYMISIENEKSHPN